MKKIFALLFPIILAACSGTTGLISNSEECCCNQKYVKSNLEFLASDELEGRETGERGNDLAALFIASELKKYGVKPAGDSGAYFQNIDFISKRFLESSRMMVSDDNGKELFKMKIGEDFFTQSSDSKEADTLHAAGRLVFAGYGITAEEYDYDDYSDIDVKNKIVVFLMGEPYSVVDSFFDGEKPTQYSDPRVKAQIAKEKGAAGILMLPDEQVLQYWSLIKDMALQSTMFIKSTDTTPESPRMMGAFISVESAEKLFAGEEYGFDRIRELVEQKEIPRAFELKKEIDCSFILEQKEVSSCNVVGIIEGTDPVLKNEYVTMGAHYDHVGVTNGNVFNGADDNGSGAVAIMEAAKQLALANDNKRSILAILYTAEEKGLYGSAFFTENFPSIKNVKVNINLDMVGRGSPDTLFVIGPDRSEKEFDETIQKTNAESTGFVFNYSLSNSHYFSQSDHYFFSKLGIPVVFFFDDVLEDLHQPTDDVEKINYRKICKTVQLVTNLAREFANTKKEFVNISGAK